jgi:PPOX class probable F420-dependent enzyme
MPGYGISAAASGMLSWEWAVERLAASHDYWLATTWADGRPHVMPVWGVWEDAGLWFSSSLQARKARNLARDPRCVLTTDNPREPVVLEGIAELVRDIQAIGRFAAWTNAKYGTDYAPEFFEENGCYRVRPTWVFALDSSRFAESPTRWVF